MTGIPVHSSCAGFGIVLGTVAMGLAGCGGDATVTTAQVRVSVDPASCGTTDLGALSLAFEGEIGVRALDSNGNDARPSHCIEIEAESGRTLHALPALLRYADVTFDDFAVGDRVGIEVAVYRPSQDGACAHLSRDGAATRGSLVYYGRSAVVPLTGPAPVIPLTLACVERVVAAPLAYGGEPRPGMVQVTATVTDLETLAPLASGLTYLVNLSFGDVMGPVPSATAAFEPLADLFPSGVGGPWEATLADPPSIAGCPATRVGYLAERGSAVSCQAETSADGRHIETVGYYVNLDYLPALSSLGEEVVEAVVVGRVVDAADLPVAGATVQVLGSSALVLYLSEDRTEFTWDTGQTASHGYFAIASFSGTACCYTLAAQTSGFPMLSGFSLAPVAWLQGDLTTALIRVQ